MTRILIRSTTCIEVEFAKFVRLDYAKLHETTGYVFFQVGEKTIEVRDETFSNEALKISVGEAILHLLNIV